MKILTRSCYFNTAEIFYKYNLQKINLDVFYLQQASDDDNDLPTRPEEPEESAAEKIYATLRECREQADPKKQKGK